MRRLAEWADFGTSTADVARRLGVGRRRIFGYLAGECKRFNLLRASLKSSQP